MRTAAAILLTMLILTAHPQDRTTARCSATIIRVDTAVPGGAYRYDTVRSDTIYRVINLN